MQAEQILAVPAAGGGLEEGDGANAEGDGPELGAGDPRGGQCEDAAHLRALPLQRAQVPWRRTGGQRVLNQRHLSLAPAEKCPRPFLTA